MARSLAGGSLCEGTHRDQPKPPRALGVCSIFHGNYCHCQVGLEKGQ